MTAQAELFQALGDMDKAVAVLDQVLLRPSDAFRFEALMKRAQFLVVGGDFKAAFAAVKLTLDRSLFVFRTTIHERLSLALCSRCQYELGDYQGAIESGDMCLEMNRHYEGAYTYVAKSHAKLGNWLEAVKVMRRALAYETPWDEENVCAVRLELVGIVSIAARRGVED
jgi:tetratricopeptide (TPR) repeat protein